jgi:hypothetical protein
MINWLLLVRGCAVTHLSDVDKNVVPGDVTSDRKDKEPDGLGDMYISGGENAVEWRRLSQPFRRRRGGGDRDAQRAVG